VPESLLDLSRLADSWMLVLRSQHKSPRTLRAYRVSVQSFLAFSDTLDKSRVIEWLATLEHAEPATVRLRLVALKQFAKWLAAEEDFDADPILVIRPPKLDQKPVPDLPEDDIARLLKACNGKDWRSKRDKAMVLLLTETGMRAEELLGLDVTDVDLPGCIATVRRGKGAKGRKVRFSPTTAAAIDRYLRAVTTSGPLWLGSRGRLSLHWDAPFPRRTGRTGGHNGLPCAPAAPHRGGALAGSGR
jgi:integrase/recombinase XerD